MHRNIRPLIRAAALGLAAAIGIGGGEAWAQAHSFTGPISPYYLNNVGGTIYVVQGTSVINSFPWSYACGNNECEANLAIAGGHVNTNWLGKGHTAGSPGVAGQYTLSGTPTGVSWPNSPLPPGPDYGQFILDGTSDGIRNYAADNRGALHVIAYDLQWQNPTVLFDLPGGGGAITYDPVDNALWIGSENNPTVYEYSLTGTLLRSFPTQSSFPLALAYDPADDTLWLVAITNLLYQFSKTGEILQYGTIADLPVCCYYAGEIAGPSVAPAPEPTSLALLGAGLAGLCVALRRRNRLPA